MAVKIFSRSIGDKENDVKQQSDSCFKESELNTLSDKPLILLYIFRPVFSRYLLCFPCTDNKFSISQSSYHSSVVEHCCQNFCVINLDRFVTCCNIGSTQPFVSMPFASFTYHQTSKLIILWFSVMLQDCLITPWNLLYSASQVLKYHPKEIFESS